MKKLLFYLILTISSVNIFADQPVNYENVKKYILEQYSCNSIETCVKKPYFAFTAEKFKKDLQNHQELLILIKNLEKKDETAIATIQQLQAEYQTKVSSLQKNISKVREYKHAADLSGLTLLMRVLPRETPLLGEYKDAIYNLVLIDKVYLQEMKKITKILDSLGKHEPDDSNFTYGMNDN